MKKEIVILEKTVKSTQQTLNQWISQGYEIKILAQSDVVIQEELGKEIWLITTVERTKK